MAALFAGLLTMDVGVENPRATKDRYNRTYNDWTSTDVPELPSALPFTLGSGLPVTWVKGWLFVSQRRMEESYQNEDQATADGACFLQPDAPVTSSSRLWIHGERYEVFGNPSLVYGAFGPHHWEVRVKRFVNS